MNAHDKDAAQAREESYQEVSLRAVELLAKAQRAADEAVAEAQSYARDLEESAREQYKQILLRAQTAAQQLAPAGGPASVGQGVTGGERGAFDAQQLAYVRTYARVAHAQLKSVLAALNDELDQLAAMAEGNTGAPDRPGPLGPSTAPELPAGPQMPAAPHGPAGLQALPDAFQRPESFDKSGPGSGGTTERIGSTDDVSWPPIFAATNAISYVYRGSSSDGPRP